ncbi:hypothetical protein [Ruegeria lacuscaerulensis]|uniref:hypothetical protein n=1 Tax=Ruegeria lacuscaerulensis TaxID=55218 RepID=UPI001479EE4B|nr:hypothetical protein [Ruegeria lacuscaerulensis]
MEHSNTPHLAATPHGMISEPLQNIFFVTGTREWHFNDLDWQFSRNMTVVRDGDQLTLFNAVRLSDDGLKDLEKLGQIANVVQVGGLHGSDDAFYRDVYGASYWAQPGAGQDGVPVDRELTEGGELPVSGAELFTFKTTSVPECIFRLERDGGVLIACDALQNYLKPDEFFSEQSAQVMTDMGFFTPANVGPVWMQAAQPEAEDFRRLSELSFQHVFCGHGAPVLEGASEAYGATFKRLFDI